MLLESNKTKIAKRVIEVFEFFDGGCQRATVMDIVRRYGRPQSSTSELLASLVDLGLLYKDPQSRAYFPTPRLATLGMSAQPRIVRDGRLFAFMDQLAAATGACVAMFGIVGTHVQIFQASRGAGQVDAGLECGAVVPLSATPAGLLLMSTFSREQAARMLWRLNAEAPADAKFNPAQLGERIALFRRQGHGTGDAGFAPGMMLTAVLLPCAAGERPLALGVIQPAGFAHDAGALAETLEQGIRRCGGPGGEFPIQAVAAFNECEPQAKLAS